MKNKKKYIIAVSAFIVCFVMFVFAIKLQRMYADSLSNKQESAEKVENKSANADAADTKIKQNITTKESEKKQESVSNGSKISNETKDLKNEINQDKPSSSTMSKSQTDPSTKVTKSENVKVKPEDPVEQMSLQIIDIVHGNKMILQKNVNNMDGETVGYITEKILDEAKIKYKATGSASTVYFAAIDGLEEKKAGTLSGWCYYVKKKSDTRFHKPNVGSGQWIYHNGDIVVWKYLTDGIHDGYEADWGKGSFKK